MINDRELKSRLVLNEDTGDFFNLVSKGRFCKRGEKAGCLHETGYVHIKINGKSYAAHRLVWLYVYGSFPSEYLDHINGDKSDNRISNLRLATHSENLRNKGKNKNNKSGFKGVIFSPSKKWIAQVSVNGVKQYLGTYETAEMASNVYQEFCKNNYGDFYHE